MEGLSINASSGPLTLPQPPGEARVLVAVSAGADSSALALLLSRSEACRRLELGWVVHGFRPAQEAAERGLLRTLADRSRAPLHELQLTPPPGWSPGDPIPEDSARRARYRVLEECARRRGLDVLATGHHARDQIETQLLHLSRGTGLRGLAGIPRCRPLGSRLLWRPLLEHSPAALRRLLRDEGLEWSEDPSNLDPRSPRNRFRHRLLPGPDAECAALLSALPRLGPLARRALTRLEERCRALLEAHQAPSLLKDALLMPAAPLLSLGPALLHHLLETALGTALRGRESEELSRWILAAQRGRKLGRAYWLERSGPWLALGRLAGRTAARGDPCWSVSADESIAPDFARWALHRAADLPAGSFSAHLPTGSQLRLPRSGDHMRTAQGERRLRALFQQAQIPRCERELWPVVEKGQRILWLPGLAREPQLATEMANARIRGIPDPRARLVHSGASSRLCTAANPPGGQR